MFDTLTTQQIAEIVRLQTEPFQRILNHSSVQTLRPPIAAGVTHFDEPQVTILSLLCDLVRAGIKVPLAAAWATRIKEQLHYYPSDTVRIQFHANGALFFLTTDDAPDAAAAAGPVRWVMTFDLAEYRGVFRRALDAKRASFGEVA